MTKTAHFSSIKSASFWSVTDKRRSVTITSVAQRVGVARPYLSRHPSLGPRVRQTTNTTPVSAVSPSQGEPGTIEATLRRHIRALNAGHSDELAELEQRVRTLEAHNANLRGQLLTSTAFKRSGPPKESL